MYRWFTVVVYSSDATKPNGEVEEETHDHIC